MASRQCDELITPVEEQWIVGDKERGVPLVHEHRKSSVDFALSAGI